MKTQLCLWILLTALWSLAFFSCTKRNDPEPNLPPSNFTVTAKLGTNGTDIILTWTLAKDPNNSPVSYAVVYKDTLAEGLTDTTFTITNVDYGITASGSVIARNSRGATTVATFSLVIGTHVFIPDQKLENYLIGIGADDVFDGKISLANAKKVTYINLSRNNSESRPVFTLQGIQAFPNLTYLDCGNNMLGSLDVSKNTKLVYLNCSGNQGISILDITNNGKLVQLSCSYTSLAQLDTRKNPKLETLRCFSVSLPQLDVSKNTVLTTLDCSYNQLLNKLDLSNNKALLQLYCSNTQLDKLDLSQNTLVIGLYCSSNKLTTLDISQNAALRELICDNNQLAALNVTKNTVLTYLSCSTNRLTELDISQNRPLRYLFCYSNQLIGLDLRNNPVLQSMNCTKNNIQTICVADSAHIPSNWYKDNTTVYQACK